MANDDIWMMGLDNPITNAAPVRANSTDLQLVSGYGLEIDQFVIQLEAAAFGAPDANPRNITARIGFKGATDTPIADSDTYVEVCLSPQHPMQTVKLKNPRIIITTTPWMSASLSMNVAGDTMTVIGILHGRAIKLSQSQVLEALQQLTG